MHVDPSILIYSSSLFLGVASGIYVIFPSFTSNEEAFSRL